MADRRTPPWAWGTGISILVAASVCLGWFGLAGQRPGSDVPGTDKRDIDTAPTRAWTTNQLFRMDWADLADASAVCGVDAAHRSACLGHLERLASPPAQYLRALLLLADEQPYSALITLNAIGADQIPGIHLYAPHRLHRTLRPGQPSPYRAGLEIALQAGTLPPLIEARSHVLEGRVEHGLAAYARTDPAEWVRYDVRSLQAIHRHAGLRPDAAMLLRGALRAGRVPEPLRAELIAVVTGPSENLDIEPGLRQELVSRLQSNPGLRLAAATATRKQLETRRLFALRDYDGLLEGAGHVDARAVTDETALLFLLSAARVARPDALDRWAQEIRRRFPTPEVKAWIQTLRPDVP